jgi:membrane protease YdiL (CAAX protease family)
MATPLSPTFRARSPLLRTAAGRESVTPAMVASRDGHPFGARAVRPNGAGFGALENPGPIYTALAAYGAMAAIATGVSIMLGRNPLECEGWLGAHGAAAWLLSLGSGVALGAVTIAATRLLVRRATWAHALHVALRPAVHGVSDGALFALAAASGAGEELLFRGVLVPLMGIAFSSLTFGLLHQVRGQARWAWMAWATVMGALFAAVFSMTGSLAGALVAHAAINHANLRFLRDNDLAPRERHLGGLLKR